MTLTPEQTVTRYGTLLAVYGPLLNEEGRQLMHLYYDEDLSLSEIAASRASSRQAVSGALQRQRRELDRFEAALNLVEREELLQDKLERLRASIRAGENVAALSLLDQLEDWLRED